MTVALSLIDIKLNVLEAPLVSLTDWYPVGSIVNAIATENNPIITKINPIPLITFLITIFSPHIESNYYLLDLHHEA
ncbi:Uncharacterised protein [uncultured archaeon]|nr:Uncharacterised protein [uncultured archaeon]